MVNKNRIYLDFRSSVIWAKLSVAAYELRASPLLTKVCDGLLGET